MSCEMNDERGARLWHRVARRPYGTRFGVCTIRLTCRFEPTWKHCIPVKLWYEGSRQKINPCFA